MKKVFSTILALTLGVCLSLTCFAANGDGNGSGGGKNQPLNVESASIQDGDCVLPDSEITLTFSKNVVNSTVREANIALFKVEDANGNAVSAEIVMADDQVEPEKKNDVVIRFPQPLADGSYTVTAMAGITSKSGDKTESDYVLSFEVKSQTEQPSGEVSGEVSDETSSEVPSESAEPQTDAPAKSSSSTIILVVVAVIAVAAVFVIIKKKK